jgi:hypothetical protein
MHTRLRFKFETKILNERLAAKPLSTLFLSSHCPFSGSFSA